MKNCLPLLSPHVCHPARLITRSLFSHPRRTCTTSTNKSHGTQCCSSSPVRLLDDREQLFALQFLWRSPVYISGSIASQSEVTLTDPNLGSGVIDKFKLRSASYLAFRVLVTQSGFYLCRKVRSSSWRSFFGGIFCWIYLAKDVDSSES